MPTKLEYQGKGGKNWEKTKNASAIFPTLVHVQPNGQMMTIRNLLCYKPTKLIVKIGVIIDCTIHDTQIRAY